MSQTRNSARPVSRPGQHPPFQFGILLRGEPGGATGDLAIAQPGNALGIVSLHRPGQIPRRQANQFRRFLTAAPVQDVGNAKQATHHLPGLLQPSQQPQTLRVAVLPHRDHRRSPPSDVSLRARHPKMLTQETTDLSRDPYYVPLDQTGIAVAAGCFASGTGWKIGASTVSPGNHVAAGGRQSLSETLQRAAPVPPAAFLSSARFDQRREEPVAQKVRSEPRGTYHEASPA